ncbi:MAG TPA: GntR family transcriptional regulator [Candidatus Dormibacteraeota bacterium]|nr:GntR family transcriptional regulator [Candidatus Dormibacteraeota bacterium]
MAKAGETTETMGRRPLRRDHPLPLWAQLAAELQRRIDGQEFATAFPTELELSSGYQVSRHTVREALRKLRTEGVVDSRRGRGSRVVEPRFQQPVGALYSLFRFVESQGAEQTSQVRRLEQTTNALAARKLGLPPEGQLIYLERLRLADGDPLALDRAWVSAGLGGPLLKADFSHSALYDQMAALCGTRPDSGREEIRAVVPTATERALLKLRSGTGAFQIERLGYADLEPIEWRSTLIRADRYSFAIDWLGRHSVRVGAQRSSLGRAPIDG